MCGEIYSHIAQPGALAPGSRINSYRVRKQNYLTSFRKLIIKKTARYPDSKVIS